MRGHIKPNTSLQGRRGRYNKSTRRLSASSMSHMPLSSSPACPFIESHKERQIVISTPLALPREWKPYTSHYIALEPSDCSSSYPATSAIPSNAICKKSCWTIGPNTTFFPRIRQCERPPDHPYEWTPGPDHRQSRHGTAIHQKHDSAREVMG